MSRKTSVARYQRLNRPQYGQGKRHNKTKRKSLVWGLSLLAFLSILAYGGWRAYSVYTAPVGRHTETQYIFVGKKTTLQDVERQIQTKLQPRHPNLLAHLIDYESLERQLRPGRYAVTPEMTTHELVKLLVSGAQTPIRMTLGALRTESDLVRELDKYLMLDSLEIVTALTDSTRLARLGMTREEVRSLFLRGVYEIRWNISGDELMSYFEKYHNDFWTLERRAKADSLGLSTAEIASLGAIVEGESAKKDEYARIAGLYINRLKKGMMLQSDPTVIYAIGDFTIRRVLTEHLKVDSPYNTYKVVGLTPGPIRLPKPETLDYVLNAEPHKYIYMCARETFDGYHNFAVDYSTHLVNARKYQRVLPAYLKAREEAKKQKEQQQ